MNKTTLSTPTAPAAIGPYSQAVQVDKILYTSGQIALDPATMEVVAGGIAEQSRQVLDNLMALLAAAGSDAGQVIKTTCFLSDMDDFTAFNEVYSHYFPQEPPARSCVEVARLPKDVLVEIEAMALVP
ncbi:RidA family protein [Desulfogranum mediterraneum]|uniref:RidA family protein n=1 Tax=Desulfogranum mediterraneum TaxID=160661 RepID=UPI0004143BF2|nr:RidA family protein [Desulfogranum mediterraneum]